MAEAKAHVCVDLGYARLRPKGGFMTVHLPHFLIGSLVVAGNPPTSTPGGRYSQFGTPASSFGGHACAFPDESEPRKPAELTGLGFAYYPAFWCRGWYGAFPAPGDVLNARTVSFSLLDYPFKAAATADAQITAQGGALEVALATETQRLGMMARILGMLLNNVGSASGNQTTILVNVHLSFAVINDPRGRLRLEAGFGSAFAPTETMPGMSVGASGAIGIAGPVGLEIYAQVTPLPYREYDLHEAFTFAMGTVAFSLGWRTLYLDGLGPLDLLHDHGVYNGPNLGLSIRL
jgi:hypothetical protein